MNDNPKRQLFHRIQSIYVLPLARGMYLLMALISLVTIIGGSIFAFYLQTLMSRQPSIVPIPPQYRETAPVADISTRTVDLTMVSARLEPPTNIRFIVTTGEIEAPLRQGAPLGYFIADTPNKLASFPDGISILGGRDAELFEKTFDSEHKMIGLKARTALSSEITDVLHDIKDKKTRTFEISVTARDQYGIRSPATNISIVLNFGPEPIISLEPQPEPEQEITELQKIAGDIAKTIEPTMSPERKHLYQMATAVPRRCGVADSDQIFVVNYRRAFEEVRSHLSTLNVEAFYVGLCESWKDALQRESLERERIARVQAAAYRQAEDERARAQAHNYDVLRKHETEVYQAKENTSLTISVIVGALATFLSISIILAFMAIEGHSRAVREAIESMARISEERKNSEVA